MLDINEYLRTEGPSEIEMAELGEDVATARRLVALLHEKIGEVNDVLSALAACRVDVEVNVGLDRYVIGSPRVPVKVLSAVTRLVIEGLS